MKKYITFILIIVFFFYSCTSDFIDNLFGQYQDQLNEQYNEYTNSIKEVTNTIIIEQKTNFLTNNVYFSNYLTNSIYYSNVIKIETNVVTNNNILKATLFYDFNTNYYGITNIDDITFYYITNELFQPYRTVDMSLFKSNVGVLSNVWQSYDSFYLSTNIIYFTSIYTDMTYCITVTWIE